MNKADHIARIRELHAELETLGVKREKFDFYRLSDEEVEEIADSIGEQVKTRKRFLERAEKPRIQ